MLYVQKLPASLCLKNWVYFVSCEILLNQGSRLQRVWYRILCDERSGSVMYVINITRLSSPVRRCYTRHVFYIWTVSGYNYHGPGDEEGDAGISLIDPISYFSETLGITVLVSSTMIIVSQDNPYIEYVRINKGYVSITFLVSRTICMIIVSQDSSHIEYMPGPWRIWLSHRYF